MKIRDGYLLKSIGDKYVAVYSGTDPEGLKGMIWLNSAGAFLWKLLEKETTEKQLTDAVTEHYDVPEETAAKDIAAVLRVLKNAGIIEE